MVPVYPHPGKFPVDHTIMKHGTGYFTGAASKIAQRDGRLVEMYLFVAVVYFLLCYTLSYTVKLMQNRIAVIR